jgi:hypothetical protein
MTDELERLLESLLFEGYALYPYTPGATKNATPTPFGIVYPPAYAATLPSVFDRLELRCVLEAPPDAVLSAEVRFLTASGERHEAAPRRVVLSGAMVGALERAPSRRTESVAAGAAPSLPVVLELSAERQPDGAYEVALTVENRTRVPSGLDRAGALARSLLATHPLVRVTGGRFVSPLERPCAGVNTFPVLATRGADVVLGATVALPDHPQIAPESRGSHFDATEIEEALLLHIHALSDDERAEIERHDPRVREMITRAASSTPQDLLALHGRVTIRDPQTNEPPIEPEWLPDPRAGEETAEVAGMRFRRGARVVIRPAATADVHARLLDGRTATIERIYADYDGVTHLAVTVDGDPGQQLMRETGRYLFFHAHEVEVLDDER